MLVVLLRPLPPPPPLRDLEGPLRSVVSGEAAHRRHGHGDALHYPPLPAAVIAVVNALVLQCGRGREVRRRPAIPGHVAAAPGRRQAVTPVVLPACNVTVRLIVHGCVLVQGLSRDRNARLAILVPRRRRRAILLRQPRQTHTAVSSPLLLLFSQQAGAVDATTEAAPIVPACSPPRRPLLDLHFLPGWQDAVSYRS